MDDWSQWKTADDEVQKPEIIANGQFNPDGILNSGDEFYGTSYSSPLVAGYLASSLQGVWENGFNYPEFMRAYLLSITKKATNTSDYLTAKVDSARTLDRNPYMRHGGSTGTESNNWLAGGIWREIDSFYMSRNWNLKTAISWKHEPNKLMRIEMAILTPDSKIKCSTKYADTTHERSTNRICDWRTDVLGVYKLYVRRYLNESDSDVEIGYATSYDYY